jgi:hypothetical protein
MDPSTESLIWVVVLAIGGILFFVGHIIKEVFSSSLGDQRDKDKEPPKGDEESPMK